MKKIQILIIVLTLAVATFLIGGCGEPTVYSHRSSLELGMTLPEAWLASNKPHYDLISESINDNCKIQIYRFWFDHPEDNQSNSDTGDFFKNLGKTIRYVGERTGNAGEPNIYRQERDRRANKYDPYLLTFRDCTISDDAAINAERKRRADAWLVKNPDLAKEMEKLCQEQGLSPSNKATLIELVDPGVFSDLSRSGLDSLLIRIDYDAEMVAGNQNQRNQDQYLDHLRRMEQLKQQEIQNQQFDSMQNSTPIHIRPDGAGGYVVY